MSCLRNASDQKRGKDGTAMGVATAVPLACRKPATVQVQQRKPRKPGEREMGSFQEKKECREVSGETWRTVKMTCAVLPLEIFTRWENVGVSGGLFLLLIGATRRGLAASSIAPCLGRGEA